MCEDCKKDQDRIRANIKKYEGQKEIPVHEYSYRGIKYIKCPACGLPTGQTFWIAVEKYVCDCDKILVIQRKVPLGRTN